MVFNVKIENGSLGGQHEPEITGQSAREVVKLVRSLVDRDGELVPSVVVTEKEGASASGKHSANDPASWPSTAGKTLPCDS